MKLIETDAFSFEFLSQIGERESWRKEVHRPIYHVHKWWAKRLGTVFRGILLGCTLGPNDDLQKEFYRQHDFSRFTVFDPFMGSGTTVGEAHKLGLAALGRDINPVAVNAVRVALGPLDRRRIQVAFDELSHTVGDQLRSLYRSKDSQKRTFEVLYHFWLGRGVTLRVRCPKARAILPTLVGLIPAADWYEREVHELLGIEYAGHPGLGPLLLPDDWDAPPPLLSREDVR